MKIGLLNAYLCDPDPNSYQYQYEPMFRSYFTEHVSNQWELIEYRITQGQWPDSIHACDSWIIGGSPKSVYDPDKWITKLIGLVQECHEKKKPLLGVCFGHQLIAQALGGKAAKSSKGWGVGVRRFKLSATRPWMTKVKQDCALLFSHQDQVEKLPQEAELLASDAFCPHQIYMIGDHILSIQRHPEFTSSYMLDRLEARKAIIGDEAYQAACASLTEPTNAVLIGTWIHAFFTQARNQ